jgi:hypothetical protein
MPLCVVGRGPSTVDVAAPAAVERLGPQLPLKLHEAPHPSAVRADVGLDVGGQFVDGGQVDAEQLRAPFQLCRDRPAQVGVVPGSHGRSLSNTRSTVEAVECFTTAWALASIFHEWYPETR